MACCVSNFPTRLQKESQTYNLVIHESVKRALMLAAFVKVRRSPRRTAAGGLSCHTFIRADLIAEHTLALMSAVMKHEGFVQPEENLKLLK